MKALFRRLSEQPWEGWPQGQVAERGTVTWKELIGAAPSDGTNMVIGVVRVRKGEVLKAHRHSEPESYYTLSGNGGVRLDDEFIAVAAGTALFIPGNALHSIENPQDEDLLILYSFAVDNWNKVVYRF